ncbi:helix-turn-helix domain-containing protein [Dyella halodurans]|uniref:Helix-turn-helix domain-containing protein n=1 Tax=Dyella halodurans TaxID=1920171 RepID=A0ABV9C0T5_9GAMM|nr:helix-turn-helix transcriptional regulator [Dyella halodurans]
MDTWKDKIVALEARGWTLTGIGNAVDLSPSSISDIKQGRCKNPGGMAAVKIHNLFSTGALPPGREVAANAPHSKRKRAA